MSLPDLPRNTIDISHIIKLPPPPQKTELQQNMDKFCELLERILTARENNKQISDDEEDNYRRTDVEKELKNSVTKGIEKLKAVEHLSEKQRIKRGKVSLGCLTFIKGWSFFVHFSGDLYCTHYSKGSNSAEGIWIHEKLGRC